MVRCQRKLRNLHFGYSISPLPGIIGVPHRSGQFTGRHTRFTQILVGPRGKPHQRLPAFFIAAPVESVDKALPLRLPREWSVRRIPAMPRRVLDRLTCHLEFTHPVAGCRDAALQRRTPPTLMPWFGAKRSSIFQGSQMVLRRAGISTSFCTKLWKNLLERADASKKQRKQQHQTAFLSGQAGI